MQCDLDKIKQIVMDVKIKGVGGVSPQDATGYLVCFKGYQSDDKNLMRDINELIFQLEGQPKIKISDYKDHQKRQQIVDLILRLDKTTRDTFIEKGLDSIVLVNDSKMRQYLEEIIFTLESMDKKPNLSEVVNMFKTPDPFA